MEKIMIDITAITSTSDYVAFGGKLCRSKRISKPERCKKKRNKMPVILQNLFDGVQSIGTGLKFKLFHKSRFTIQNRVQSFPE